MSLYEPEIAPLKPSTKSASDFEQQAVRWNMPEKLNGYNQVLNHVGWGSFLVLGFTGQKIIVVWRFQGG